MTIRFCPKLRTKYCGYRDFASLSANIIVITITFVYKIGKMGPAISDY